MKKLKTGEVIQQVAAELFRKFGFEKTSMDEIARKAHKAKRSIYNHFSSKEDLFCASVQSELANVRSRLLAVVEDDSQRILPRLKQYLLLRMELIAEASTLRVAMKSNMLNSEDYGFDNLKKLMVDFNQWEHQAFKMVWYAKPSEEVPQIIDQQAVAFADMLQVTLNGLSYSFFVEDKYEQYKSSYEMLIDLIVNSVFQSFVNKYGKNKAEMTH